MDATASRGRLCPAVSISLKTFQMQSVQQMQNSKARAIYEANLPEDFRRPQTDSAVEAFIRQKYEKKKYILANWQPSKPPDFPVLFKRTREH